LEIISANPSLFARAISERMSEKMSDSTLGYLSPVEYRLKRLAA